MNLRILPLISLGLIPASVGAAGYYLPNQDAFATARGNAFVASADRPSAVFYNPAGLTQLESPEAEVGIYAIDLGTEVTKGHERFGAKSEWQAVPHLYYGQPINDKLAWGFGINSPFGLGNHWGQGSPFRTVVTEAKLIYVATTLAVAYDVTDTLSVGAGVSYNYANLMLEQGLGYKPLDFLRVHADGDSVSGELGVRWQPTEKHAFGLTATTETSQELKGKVYSNILGTGPASIDFQTPMKLAFGYSYRPAPGWNFETNVEWLDWDSLNSLYLRSSHVPNGGINVPFDWKSSFIYEAGVSYTLDNGYSFAVGYDYNSNSQPDANYTPSVGDADRHWFNAGFGKDYGCWSWFLTYQFGYANRVVSGASNTAAGENANGKYQSRNNAVSVSITRHF
jgi:long-chain fatty acid transport protein